MHPFKLATLSSATVLVFVLSASDAFAGNDACKILTAEKFSEIMGSQECVVLVPFCAYRANIRAPGLWLIAISPWS